MSTKENIYAEPENVDDAIEKVDQIELKISELEDQIIKLDSRGRELWQWAGKNGFNSKKGVYKYWANKWGPLQ